VLYGRAVCALGRIGVHLPFAIFTGGFLIGWLFRHAVVFMSGYVGRLMFLASGIVGIFGIVGFGANALA